MIKIGGETIKFERFPNNESLLKNHEIIIRDSLPNENSTIYINFKYIDDSSLMELYLIKQEIDLKFPKSKTFLRITYLPYSRMDRGSTSTCFTLKHISKFINNLQFDGIVIGEPHSNVCLEMINNSVPRWYTKELLSDYLLSNEFDPALDAVLFPDNGAHTRYRDILLFEIPYGSNIIIGEKKRNFETGRIEELKLNSSSENIRNVIIVDDLCSYGGTFVLALDSLKAMGVKKADLIVGNCEKSIVDGDLLNHPLLKKVYTTNSIINRVYENEYPKLNIKAVI